MIDLIRMAKKPEDFLKPVGQISKSLKRTTHGTNYVSSSFADLSPDSRVNASELIPVSLISVKRRRLENLTFYN